MNNDKLKNRINNSGFTVIEVLITLAIILTIAVPFLRYFYHEELQKLGKQVFDLSGIGEIGQILLYGILGVLVIYLKIRPDIIEAKKRNRPLISKPIKLFALFSSILVVVLIYIGVN